MNDSSSGFLALTKWIPAELFPENLDWLLTAFEAKTEVHTHQASSDFIAKILDLEDLVAILRFQLEAGLEDELVRHMQLDARQLNF